MSLQLNRSERMLWAGQPVKLNLGEIILFVGFDFLAFALFFISFQFKVDPLLAAGIAIFLLVPVLLFSTILYRSTVHYSITNQRLHYASVFGAAYFDLKGPIRFTILKNKFFGDSIIFDKDVGFYFRNLKRADLIEAENQLRSFRE